MSGIDIEKLIDDIDQAEQDGFFDDMFMCVSQGETRKVTAPDILGEIHPDMKLTKYFFLRIYGKEITYPGFADTAIQALEEAGCSKARTYYETVVNDHQTKQEEALKEVSEWYRRKVHDDFLKLQKGSEELRKQEIMEDLHQKSDRELLNLLQSMS